MHACMDVCVYVCIGIEINTCVSGYAHAYIHIHFGKHVYMFIPRHVYIYIYIFLLCVLPWVDTPMRACVPFHIAKFPYYPPQNPKTLNCQNPSAPKASPHKEQPGGRLDDVDADHLVKGEKDGRG